MLIGLSYSPAGDVTAAVLFLCFLMALNAGTYAGYMVCKFLRLFSMQSLRNAYGKHDCFVVNWKNINENRSKVFCLE